MDKSFSTMLELRWGGKNPRIIFDDGIDVLFYVNGDKHDYFTIWQNKEGLNNFYSHDPDRYHGNLWVGGTDLGLCKWIQNVTLALEKNGISKNNMYLATREIFGIGMKDDPTDETTVYKIFEILKKYFGTLTGEESFNQKDRVIEGNKVIDFGYNFKYRYDGVRDLVYLFLTGYAFHYGNCARYISGNRFFNMFRSLKYKDLFYRSIFHAQNSVNDNMCENISRIYYVDGAKRENENQAIERVKNVIIKGEIGVEILIKNEKVQEEKKQEIIDKINKEILDNEKYKRCTGFDNFDNIDNILISIDTKIIDSIKNGINKCWACEKDISCDRLIKVSRPIGLINRVDEMECLECAKLSDNEYIKKMNEKWNIKINDEVSKEYENDINNEIVKEYEKEIENEAL